ncbi:MAG: hypothetical protein QOH08_866 [Chloroflexota bacterium]|jgi:hypothetical protein|nr:hypothetical protein [Chloroflexota bacterium]
MTGRDPRLLVVQRIAGVLCLGLVALVVTANLGCAPKYFGRGDVIALLVIGIIDAVLLLGASSGDSDVHRAVGVGSSASAAALFLSTASIPILFAPIVIAGAFRLPRSTRLRVAVLLVIPIAVVATAGLLILGQSLVSADQFRCP